MIWIIKIILRKGINMKTSYSTRFLSAFLALLMIMSVFAVMPLTAGAEETQIAEDPDFKGMTFSTDQSAEMWKMPHTLKELPYTIETWFNMPTTVTSGRGGTIFSSYTGSGAKQSEQ